MYENKHVIFRHKNYTIFTYYYDRNAIEMYLIDYNNNII